ncbi:ORF6N domain-containing protein [Segetibacter aerophilus]|uniref:DNA-binding protein n=1 Tax=Segetibacter aerophilus TaxID=670293 RepID=A0A512BBF5_9BACT|nr:ORF6N domain-containing protein [Segetibacter aerophilus]GEO09302.1 DNA-binding protein [Segetibacter aerophilus]
MAKSLPQQQISEQIISEKIYVVRGVKIMLDRDLAEMYGVSTGRLNEAVKRNITRFPEDFMFQLKDEEWNNLKSQFVTSGYGGIRKLPFAFTEQGVAMLSSVLRSERAIQVNIQIVRVYTRMKQILFDNKELWIKLEKIEQALFKKDEEVKLIFNTLKALLIQEEKPRTEIGFLANRKEKKK